MRTNSIPYYMVGEAMNVSKNVLSPAVGLLGTYYVGSDRYACVITEVLSPKKVRIINMISDSVLGKKLIDSEGIERLDEDTVKELVESEVPKFSDYSDETPEVQAELFEADTARYLTDNTFSLRKNGRWVREGDGLWDCCSIHFGVADPYRDPDF